LFYLPPPAYTHKKTLLYCGQVIDPKAGKTLGNVNILIEGDKISGIREGYTQPGSSDIVIDFKKRTVMPGLIDMHVHLELEMKKADAIDEFVLNPPEIASSSIQNARRPFKWLPQRSDG
jgi:imidazolonepropionase-like amidohydrolase